MRPAVEAIGWWLAIGAGLSTIALALFIGLARAGSRSEREQQIADQAARQRGHDIAYRIRAELVCCDIYDRVNDRGEQAEKSKGWHHLCYWGEASAQIAEGRCPGYETTPNVCQCACSGCASSCNAHTQTEETNQ